MKAGRRGIVSYSGTSYHRRPDARRDRRRPIPVPGCQRPQGLRRRRPHHPRQRQDQIRHLPPCQEQPAQRRRYSWAFSALTASPGARAHYDRRKNAGDRHAAAQRNLFGRLLGCLYHCLTVGCEYDEATAFPGSTKLSAAA